MCVYYCWRMWELIIHEQARIRKTPPLSRFTWQVKGLCIEEAGNRRVRGILRTFFSRRSFLKNKKRLHQPVLENIFDIETQWHLRTKQLQVERTETIIRSSIDLEASKKLKPQNRVFNVKEIYLYSGHSSCSVGLCSGGVETRRVGGTTSKLWRSPWSGGCSSSICSILDFSITCASHSQNEGRLVTRSLLDRDGWVLTHSVD